MATAMVSSALSVGVCLEFREKREKRGAGLVVGLDSQRCPLTRASIHIGRRRGPLVVVASSGGANKQRPQEKSNLSISSPPGSSLPPPVSSNSVGVREGEDTGVEGRAITKVVEDGDTAEPGAVEGEATEGGAGLQDPREESSSSRTESAEEIGRALSELRRAGVASGSQDPAMATDFWKGVLEETQLIEWPVFSKVLGTTGVVMAMILGSSVVLLTVNAILAASSDFVFNDPTFRDFARTHFSLVF